MSAATFEENGKVGYVRVISPSRRPYKTKDGWVGVLPYTQRNWTKILAEIGRSDVAELEWFKDATQRSAPRRRALRDPGRRPDVAHDGGMARNVRAPGHPVPAGAAAERPACATRTCDDVGFFATNFAGPPPVRRTLRQAVNVENVDDRAGPAAAAAGRRYGGRAARGRLQRGGDCGGAGDEQSLALSPSCVPEAERPGPRAGALSQGEAIRDRYPSRLGAPLAIRTRIKGQRPRALRAWT